KQMYSRLVKHNYKSNISLVHISIPISQFHAHTACTSPTLSANIIINWISLFNFGINVADVVVVVVVFQPSCLLLRICYESCRKLILLSRQSSKPVVAIPSNGWANKFHCCLSYDFDVKHIDMIFTLSITNRKN